jgi:UDP-N-acetylglucosamine 2-epimerase (non-hydrolysing)/GDP/UDP-N,N'-diacetylbacillosamine 2-epimerase (hydrolysing)
MRHITAVTVARSDYGIFLPVLRRLRDDPDIQLHLIAAGMHLSPEFGLTIRAIEADGLPIDDRVEMLLSSDSPEGIAKSMGLGTIGFAQVYGRRRPDILLTLGDRAEMHAAVIAALPFKIPVAHIHGGEISLGAIDDALRHSMTKLSHLHFVATERCARRVVQMGEESWRVTVSGAPALDNVKQMTLLSASELETRFEIKLDPPPLIVTLHPVTLEYEHTEHYVAELLAALEEVDLPIVFTKPNADTNGRIALQMVEEFVRDHPRAFLVDNLGTQAYFSLMNVAAAMIGNSSSGLIEAPSFRLPVVNIGTRQQGRCRAANVIDVGYESREILQGIRRALTAGFRAELRHLVNPFGNGNAAEIIVHRLKEVPLDDRLLRKQFYEVDTKRL